MPYTYKYPRPALTVDCVIFGLDHGKLKILLIQRADEPYKDSWALPGGFVDMMEDLESAALRELEEETGVRDVFVEQLFTFGAPKRDPRGRVVSVAYYALANLNEHPVRSGSDAKAAKWFELTELPSLAFDHARILEIAFKRLNTKVRYQPIGFELLPEEFTLSQLQDLYETILSIETKDGQFVPSEITINKRNFRTKIMKLGILREVGKQYNVAHRPATLYKFDKVKYDSLTKDGFGDIVFVTSVTRK